MTLYAKNQMITQYPNMDHRVLNMLVSVFDSALSQYLKTDKPTVANELASECVTLWLFINTDN